MDIEIMFGGDARLNYNYGTNGDIGYIWTKAECHIPLSEIDVMRGITYRFIRPTDQSLDVFFEKNSFMTKATEDCVFVFGVRYDLIRGTVPTGTGPNGRIMVDDIIDVVWDITMADAVLAWQGVRDCNFPRPESERILAWLPVLHFSDVEIVEMCSKVARMYFDEIGRRVVPADMHNERFTVVEYVEKRYPEAFDVECLPVEIWGAVFSGIPLTELQGFAQVSKATRAIVVRVVDTIITPRQTNYELLVAAQDAATNIHHVVSRSLAADLNFLKHTINLQSLHVVGCDLGPAKLICGAGLRRMSLVDCTVSLYGICFLTHFPNLEYLDFLSMATRRTDAVLGTRELEGLGQCVSQLPRLHTFRWISESGVSHPGEASILMRSIAGMTSLTSLSVSELVGWSEVTDRMTTNVQSLSMVSSGRSSIDFTVMTHLRRLQIGGRGVKYTNFSQLPVLAKLEHLGIADGESLDLSNALALVHMTTLTSLSMSRWNDLSHRTICKIISSLPLKHLALHGLKNLGIEFLECVTTKLQSLSVGTMGIWPSKWCDFSRLKNLCALRVSDTSGMPFWGALAFKLCSDYVLDPKHVKMSHCAKMAPVLPRTGLEWIDWQVRNRLKYGDDVHYLLNQAPGQVISRGYDLDRDGTVDDMLDRMDHYMMYNT